MVFARCHADEGFDVSTPRNYARRRRFGIIAPSVNTVLEPELYGLGLSHVSFHFARTSLEHGSDEEALRAMANDAPAAASLLGHVRPEMIMYACTSGSIVGGPGFDGDVARAITRQTGIPASTTATAVVQALQALGANRIGVGTPYLEWVTRAEVEFFRAAGLETIATASLGLTDGHDMAALEQFDIRQLAQAVDRPEVDAVFLSCTDLPTLDVIAQLEEELGKPVVSSNLATAWAMVGGAAELAGLARLFRTPVPPS